MPRVIRGICGKDAPAPQIVDTEHNDIPEGYQSVCLTHGISPTIQLFLPEAHCRRKVENVLDIIRNTGADQEPCHANNRAVAEYIHAKYAGTRFEIGSYERDVDPEDYVVITFMLPMTNGIRINATGVVGVVGGDVRIAQLDWNAHFESCYSTIRFHFSATSQSTITVFDRLIIMVHVPSHHDIRDLPDFSSHMRTGQKGIFKSDANSVINNIKRFIMSPQSPLIGCTFVIYQYVRSSPMVPHGNIPAIFASLLASAISDKIGSAIYALHNPQNEDALDKSNPDDEDYSDTYCSV